jgi:molecular chaperone GrpE
MVKKKAPEQEPERHEETADNKLDNNNVTESGQTVSEVPPAVEPGTIEGGEAKREEPASDKVVKDEKLFEEKLAEMQDRYLRLSAEFDNFRKRTLREKMELSKYATEEILLKIIPVMDDFERALANMENAADCAAVKTGIELIYGKFTDFLKQNGIREIESLNTAFNVDLHDAVAKTRVEDESMKGKIVDVVKKGYYLQDKIIRHAKVVVGE